MTSNHLNHSIQQELHLSDVQQKVNLLLQQHQQLKHKCGELNQHCHLLQQQLYESQCKEEKIKKQLEQLMQKIALQMVSFQELELESKSKLKSDNELITH